MRSIKRILFVTIKNLRMNDRIERERERERESSLKSFSYVYIF